MGDNDWYSDESDETFYREKRRREIEERNAERNVRNDEEGWKRRGMKMLTQDIIKKLPKLYDTEKVPAEEKVAVVKFFSPYSNWTWYGVEFDGKDTFFGYVESPYDSEWGYFSLKELSEATTNPFGGSVKIPAVERDKYWSPTKFKDIRTREKTYNSCKGRKKTIHAP